MSFFSITDPCVGCGRAPDLTRPFPGGSYHREPVEGGGYRPVYDGPLCGPCLTGTTPATRGTEARS